MLNATTWTGAVSQDWTNAQNWNNGVPGPNDDATIGNQGQAPIIAANQKAQVSTITDNGGLPLIVQSQGSLEITGNSITMPNQGSLWNADLTINGVVESDSPNNNTNANNFFWIGGNIHGNAVGTNPWGIYIADGAYWNALQRAQNLGVTMNVGRDQVNGGAVQNVTSYLVVSNPGAANRLQQNISLNNNANLIIWPKGLMYLNQATNSANAGGIVVDLPATSTSQLDDQGIVTHDGDTTGQTLVIQPKVSIEGTWSETGKNGASTINFSYNQGQPGVYSVVIAQAAIGIAMLSLGNGVTVAAAQGIWLQNNGNIYVQTAKNVANSQATINGNIYDGAGGRIQIGDGANAGSYAALTVNGNVDIETGTLEVWVSFDGNGNVSNYSHLNVFGQFAVDLVDLQNSALVVHSILTNNVNPAAGQIINIVTATTTKTSKNAPTQAFDQVTYIGPQYASALLTASGYQLTT